MGISTGLTVCTVRSTKRGSDHYGPCDQCGKACSEHFVATWRTVYIRDNGQHYLCGGGGAYGHIDCLIRQFGDLVSEDSLPRDGNIKLFPQWAVDKLRDKRVFDHNPRSAPDTLFQ